MSQFEKLFSFSEDDGFDIFNNVIKVGTGLGFIFTILSFFSILFVFASIIFPCFLEKSKRKITAFQYCVIGLLFTDLLFCVGYIPIQVITVLYGYEDAICGVPGGIFYISAEMVEALFYACGLWSIAISISLLTGIWNVSKSLDSSAMKYHHATILDRRSMDANSTSYFENNLWMSPQVKRHSLHSAHSLPTSPLVVNSPQISTPKTQNVRSWCSKLFWRRELVNILVYGIPLLCAITWSYIDIRFRMSSINSAGECIPKDHTIKEAFNIAINVIHSLLYIVIEVIATMLRIWIYIWVRALFKKTRNVIWKQTPQAKLIRSEKAKLFKQAFLYSLPFIVCGSFLLMYRIADTISSIFFLLGSKDSIHIGKTIRDYSKLLGSAHRLMYPLRGFMDGLVYFWMSSWFRKVIDACARRSDEEKQTLI